MRGKFGSSVSKSGAHDLHNRALLSFFSNFPSFFSYDHTDSLSPFVLCHPSLPLRTSLRVPGMRVALVWGGELPTFCMTVCASGYYSTVINIHNLVAIFVSQDIFKASNC